MLERTSRQPQKPHQTKRKKNLCVPSPTQLHTCGSEWEECGVLRRGGGGGARRHSPKHSDGRSEGRIAHKCCSDEHAAAYSAGKRGSSGSRGASSRRNLPQHRATVQTRQLASHRPTRADPKPPQVDQKMQLHGASDLGRQCTTGGLGRGRRSRRAGRRRRPAQRRRETAP